jgi:hypothetical protein
MQYETGDQPAAGGMCRGLHLRCGPREGIATGTIKPLSSVQFSPDNDVKCLSSAIETGDPMTGRSTLLLKAPPGCVVPWHFHMAEEQLIIISGTVLA